MRSNLLGDGGPIGGVRGIVCALLASGHELTWEEARVSPRVHHVLLFGDAVCDEEAAGAGVADVSHH